MVRAVIEHGLDRGALPIKLCYAGPFFRYERPQAGRYRQLQQVGVEAIGVDDPALDAEVIAVADAGFRSLGLDGFRLEITSLGDERCRPQYRELLQDFLFELDLDDETRRRAEINPLRVLDDKRPGMRAMTADAPVLLDHLSDVAKQHFDTVLAHLDALGVPYVLNPRMVRGLDYYTKTTFEFVHDGLGAQSGIGGGGRYDGLMRELGGQDLSGIGFGLGSTARCWRCEPRARAWGRPPAATCSACRSASRASSSWRCWPHSCAPPASASTWPTVTAGSRARCARPTVPVPTSRWCSATGISSPARWG